MIEATLCGDAAGARVPVVASHQATHVELLLQEMPALLVNRARAAELLAGEAIDIDELVAAGRLVEVYVGDAMRFQFADILDIAEGLA